MTEYTVILERGKDGEEAWSAYVPDLPRCITAGETRDEVERNIRAAISGHIAALRATGQPVPDPTSEAERVIVAA